MTFKKMILILSIAVTILIVGLLGVSYAWYSLSNSSTKFNATTANPNITVIYAQSQFISVSTGIPILEADVEQKSSKSKFTALANEELSGYNVSLGIELSQINIDDELKVDDFKIQLLENGVPIANKSGSDINGNTLILKELSSITTGNTYNYELRIWINDTGVSQNELMGKSFSGKINVSSAIKK